MNCPQCQFENREGVKFCSECGQRFIPICSKGGSQNFQGSKFCDVCGHQLIGNINQVKQREPIKSERKNVTVLFSDMSGYTSMTERLDPEEVKDLMSRIFGEIAQVIAKYEGFIERFIGDAVMAIFGVPNTHEDDPIRAIKAAREIHRVVEALSPKFEKKIGNSLSMHSGINTGLVVTGEVDVQKGAHGITGDSVNEASRLESLSNSGEILVGENTFRQAEGYFIFERLEPKRVKGKEAPIKVYRVIAPSTRRTRFDVSTERGLTPFVGRETELNILLEVFYRAKNGRGQVFSIISEAGLGKSRLLYEFRKAVAKENVTFIDGKCLSYSQNVAYYPVIDILKSNFDTSDDDNSDEITEKVRAGLKVLSIDEASTLPYILELFSVKKSGINKDQITPEGIKEQINETVKLISIKGSEIRPLIIAIEDLHWLDKSSEKVITNLIDGIFGTRILLILTYRPDFKPTWSITSYQNHVNLNRLSKKESKSIVYHLLKTDDIDNDLEKLINDKSEGTPFFLEEFIRSLKLLNMVEIRGEKCLLAKDIYDVSIPSTIQDVIMSRVDSLPLYAKEVLQTASVIEREFNYEIIKHLMPIPEEDLISRLSILKEAELIFEREIFPQTVYVFKHALTRETVYNALLHKRRVEIHKAIGKAIEKIYTDKPEEYYEVIAHHSFLGEDWQRAYKFNRKAGLKAHSFSAYEEEKKYFEASIEAITNLPRTKDRIVEEIDLRFNIRAALFPLGRHDEWAEHIDIAKTLAKEIGDDIREANSYNYLSTYGWIRGHHNNAISLCEEALRLVDSNDNFSVFITSMFHLALPLLYTGSYQRQVKLHREIAQKLSGDSAYDRHGLASLPSVLSRSFLSWGLAELGEFEEAEKWGQEGLEISNQGKNLFSATWIHAALGTVYLIQGRLNTAINLLEKALSLCRAGALSVFSFIAANLGHTYCLQENPDAALPILKEAVNPHKSNLSTAPSIYPLAALAEVYHLKGQTQKALQSIKTAIEFFKKKGERGFEAWALYHMAKIQSQGNCENLIQAIHSYRKVEAQAVELRMRPLLAHCHNGLGHLFLKINKTSESHSELLTALDLYKSMGMERWIPLVQSTIKEINP